MGHPCGDPFWYKYGAALGHNAYYNKDNKNMNEEIFHVWQNRIHGMNYSFVSVGTQFISVLVHPKLNNLLGSDPNLGSIWNDVLHENWFELDAGNEPLGY